MSDANQSDENKIIEAVKVEAKPRRGCLIRMAKILLAGVLAGVLILAALWWFISRGKPLEISPETTFLTEPRKADGRGIDYIAYFQSKLPKEMATDENGFRVVMREVGLSENWWKDLEKSPDFIRQFYKSLDLDPDVAPKTPLVDHYRAWDEWAAVKYPNLSEEERGELGAVRNDMESWFADYNDDRREFTDEWVQKNSPALDLLSRELQKEIFAWPLIRQDESCPLIFDNGLMHTALEFRSWARELNFRALWRLHQGDSVGALADLLAIKRLSRKIENCPWNIFVMTLFRIALEGVGQGFSLGANPDAPPSRAEWQTLMDDASQNDGTLSMDSALLGERLIILDMFRCLSNADQLYPVMTETKHRFPFTIFGVDWNVITRRFNRFFVREDYNSEMVDDELRAIRERPFLKRLTLRGRSEWMFANLAGMCLPAIDVAREAARRINCCRNLAKIDYAMQLYACDHDGNLPPAFTVDSDGKPLHSWRTLLLPYLGYDEIYRQIKLDEPWNSEANRRFLQHSIPEFICPSAREFQASRGTCDYPKSGETTYSVIVGPHTLFGTDGVGRPVNAPNQLLVVERCDPIPWMKPNAEITEETALSGINFNPDDESSEVKKIPGSPASFHPGGTNAALSDGGITFISDAMDKEEWAKMLGN